jgi:hypothetical protein
MRNRHVPRLCRSCQGPMAAQEDTCWRCGARWATEDTTPTRLLVIPGAASQSRDDADRWDDEGGSFDHEATIPHAVAAATT